MKYLKILLNFDLASSIFNFRPIFSVKFHITVLRCIINLISNNKLGVKQLSQKNFHHHPRFNQNPRIIFLFKIQSR